LGGAAAALWEREYGNQYSGGARAFGDDPAGEIGRGPASSSPKKKLGGRIELAHASGC